MTAASHATPISRDHDQNLERGFTLVEVLAALVVFSLSIMGLIHAGAESLKTAYALEQKTLSGIVADNQLILALREEVKAGKITGQSEMKGRLFDWTIETSAQDTPGFFKIEAKVAQSSDGQVLTVRNAFRGGGTSE